VTTINRRYFFLGFGVNSWSFLFLGYLLGASKICDGDSILLLAFKINLFEELINYLERICFRVCSLLLLLLAWVIGQYLVLFFDWFLGRGFKYFVQVIIDLVGEGFFL
jgi:hypothetical protein